MLSIPHLIVIFIVALVVFGPEKLPELARNIGKVMAEFRRHTNDLKSTFEGHLRDLEREADARRIGGGPQPVPNVPPPAAQQAMATPTIAAPGTIPSNAPNAAAVAAGASAQTPASPVEIPDAGVRKHPADDPYLANLDFEPPEDPDMRKPAEPQESDKNPERVTDGDTRSV